MLGPILSSETYGLMSVWLLRWWYFIGQNWWPILCHRAQVFISSWSNGCRVFTKDVSEVCTFTSTIDSSLWHGTSKRWVHYHISTCGISSLAKRIFDVVEMSKCPLNEEIFTCLLGGFCNVVAPNLSSILLSRVGSVLMSSAIDSRSMVGI